MLRVPETDTEAHVASSTRYFSMRLTPNVQAASRKRSNSLETSWLCGWTLVQFARPFLGLLPLEKIQRIYRLSQRHHLLPSSLLAGATFACDRPSLKGQRRVVASDRK